MSKSEELQAAKDEFNEAASEILKQFNKDYDSLRATHDAKIKAIHTKHLKELANELDVIYGG